MVWRKTREKCVHSHRQEPAEVVRFEHTTLYYAGSHRIFRDLSWTFHAGSFSFLTGVSGAGKTSLLKLIYRGIKASDGIVRVFGRDVASLSPSETSFLRQRIGLVFQDCKLIQHLSVLDNVALALQITGMDIRRARQNAIELLQWVGLENHLKDYPPTLSDGEKQRVAIARAIITRPLLLLADEPTGNVDEGTALKLMHLFEELNRMGTTIILATHNRALITKRASYTEVHLNQGRLYENLPEDQQNCA